MGMPPRASQTPSEGSDSEPLARQTGRKTGGTRSGRAGDKRKRAPEPESEDDDDEGDQDVPDEDYDQEFHSARDGFSDDGNGSNDDNPPPDGGNPPPDGGNPPPDGGSSTDGENPPDRPVDGLERQPEGESEYDDFKIVRFRERKTKYGVVIGTRETVRHQDYFPVQLGDFLLEVNQATNTHEEVRVRHYNGSERYVHRRLIETIELPWGLPRNIPVTEDEDGVGLPLGFMTRTIRVRDAGGIPLKDGEAIMTKNEFEPQDAYCKVIDWEGRAGEFLREVDDTGDVIEDDPIDTPYMYPWNLRLDSDWVTDHFLHRAEKTRSEQPGFAERQAEADRQAEARRNKEARRKKGRVAARKSQPADNQAGSSRTATTHAKTSGATRTPARTRAPRSGAAFSQPRDPVTGKYVKRS